MSSSINIPVRLRNGDSIQVRLYADLPGTLSVIEEEQVAESGESCWQLKEGAGYEYQLPPGYELEKSEIIRPSNLDSSRGRIHTNIYVGLLEIPILYNGEAIGSLILEVCSVKTGYREDYRRMLQDITVRCTELLLRQSSVVSQTFTIDATKDPQTLYQRFTFVNSIIRSDQFSDSLYRINAIPMKRREVTETHRNLSNLRRVNSSVMRQMITASARTKLTEVHPLNKRFSSLPNKVNVTDKTETTDIPENRFVKYVLETFMQFCLSIHNHPKAGERLKKDALISVELLEGYLALPVFKELSIPEMLPLHNPVLQHKEGYREVLQAYLMFDMAASLIWKGGDDVYRSGKRDVAILYEYWLFFKLLDLMEEVFGITPRSVNDLIELVDRNGEQLLELKLKRGDQKVVDGTFIADNRQLHIEFCYNRTFTANCQYPLGGSWTTQMRPDYTLSIWPEELSKSEAEVREMMVHIHFDAKYKVNNSRELFQDDVGLSEEKNQESDSNYKRADLLKMHAYKDAIRRTAGAYVLYPGRGKQTFRSYHEILPGLGAFAISPGDDNHTAFKKFLFDIVQHLLNGTSQRELHSYRTFETFREAPGPVLHGSFPNYDD